MKLHLNQAAGGYRIRRYAPGEVVINETVHTASLIVSPERIIPDWPPCRIAEVGETHLSAIVDLEPEVVLLGTGERLRFPARGATAALQERSIGVEVMDTGAACRTFNILASEGRRVVAALIVEPVAD